MTDEERVKDAIKRLDPLVTCTLCGHQGVKFERQSGFWCCCTNSSCEQFWAKLAA